VTRGALREALLTRGVHWREDPSNEDPRFDRTAVRNTMPRLASLGLTADRLAATAAHLARASAAIDHAVDTLLARTATVDGAGAIGLALPAWADAPREVRLRALSTLVQRAGGMDYPPRFEPLAAAEEAILTGPGRTTLGRAVVDFDAHRILLWREARDITPLALALGENGVFDGRWRIHLSADAPAVVVDALGDDVARRLPTDAFRPAVATAPGVFHEGALVAAPTLGLRSPGWRRDLVTMSRMR